MERHGSSQEIRGSWQLRLFNWRQIFLCRSVQQLKMDGRISYLPGDAGVSPRLCAAAASSLLPEFFAHRGVLSGDDVADRRRPDVPADPESNFRCFRYVVTFAGAGLFGA